MIRTASRAARACACATSTSGRASTCTTGRSSRASTFSSLTLQARTESGTGMIQVTLSDAEGNRCTGTVFDITETYSQISIDVGSICGGVDRIASVTIDNPGPNIGLLLDDVRFSR
jgi:hypothetical protein